MLRQSSTSLIFHLVATDDRYLYRHAANHMAFDNASLVLLDKHAESQRSMVLKVVSPELCDIRCMDCMSDRDWHFRGAGLPAHEVAETLRRMVYDDCIKNGVYLFLITNLDLWVFGAFVSESSAPYG